MTARDDYEDLLANVRQVLSTSSGRAVIWEILERCNIYVDNSTTAHQGVEGRRAVGLDILALIQEADPKAYPNLLLARQDT